MHHTVGALRKVRGAVVIVTAEPSSSAAQVLQAAVEKHCACDCSLSTTAGYRLLYPDCQPVVHVPGTTELFTLPAYKQFMCKPYQKLILYICTENDYAAGKQYAENSTSCLHSSITT